MIAAVALGIRLAIRTSRDGRIRSGLVALAAAVGTLVIMSVLAIAAADRTVNAGRHDDAGMQRVVALIVVVIGLQVAGLAGVAGRLAAAMRSRRLSSLRLLGLSARRTRLVAAVEVAVAAGAGALVGLAVYPLVRVVLAHVEVASQSWPADTLDPASFAWVAVPLGVVGVVVAVAVVPERVRMREALSQARRSDTQSPSCWRLAPLAVGVAVCLYVQIARRGDDGAAGLMLAGIVLLALGTVLVLPVFVRLAAVALLRFSSRATTLVAARRLQAQPAAVTRVVTGLLLALFVVVGARNVVAAWEATPQYVAADHQVHEEQRVGASLPNGDVDDAVSRIESFHGVRQVITFFRLQERCTGNHQLCGETAIVADCGTFTLISPTATGCRDGDVMSIGLSQPGWPSERIWTPSTTADIDPVGSTITFEPAGAIDLGDAINHPGGVLIPPTHPGLDLVLKHSVPEAMVIGDPGRDLANKLVDAGLVDHAYPTWDLGDYDFVVMLRTIVYTVAAIVVGIGLLGFAIAAIDRAMSRRRELVSLRLLGAPASAVRRSQWIEALIPITGGALLAIALGQLAGATYLAFGDDPDVPTTVPWQPTLVLACIAAAGGLIVAALTVLASNQPIQPDTIRTE